MVVHTTYPFSSVLLDFPMRAMDMQGKYLHSNTDVFSTIQTVKPHIKEIRQPHAKDSHTYR